MRKIDMANKINDYIQYALIALVVLIAMSLTYNIILILSICQGL